MHAEVEGALEKFRRRSGWGEVRASAQVAVLNAEGCSFQQEKAPTEIDEVTLTIGGHRSVRPGPSEQWSMSIGPPPRA